jgi:hypothetical protein
MDGHLGKQHSSVTLELRCQSVLRAHVRHVGVRHVEPLPGAQGNANGDFPTGAPCIWPSLNRLHYPNTRTDS